MRMDESNKMLLITYHGGANYRRFIKNCLLEAIKLFSVLSCPLIFQLSSRIFHLTNPTRLLFFECIAFMPTQKFLIAFSYSQQQCCGSIGTLKSACMTISIIMLFFLRLRRKITIIIHLRSK